MKASLLLLMLSILYPVQSTTAQSPVVTGVEHIGVNVPDLKTALPFFTDILGFTPVTEIGPFELDEAWKKKYRIHLDAEVKKIVMLRAGNGANIELFEYQSASRNMQQPYGDDIDWSHIAFYTEDINKSVAYLKSKGIEVLNDPIVSTSGPTAGESWVYFLSPWGAQYELVSYPNGKGYEKSKPKVTLWTPEKVSSTAIDTKEVEKLLKKHLATWGEKNVTKREEAIQEIYTSNVTIIDPFFTLSGTSGISNFVGELQQKHPGYIFSIARPIESHNNIARLFWQFGPKSNPNAITGQDVFVLENNRIRSLYIFIDGLKK